MRRVRRESFGRPRLPVLTVAAIWTLWGVWSVHQRNLAALLSGTTAPDRANPWQLTMATAWVWVVITLVIMWTARQVRDRISSRSGRLAAHLGAFLLLHLADVTVYWLATGLAASTQRPFPALLFSLLTFNALTYTAVAFGITAIDAAQSLRERATREAQLESQLALAQLHTLRAQLHPHFLFNALNAVSSLIHTDPQRADRMLAQFSDLLRTAIDTAPRPEVPLAEELAFARRYLEIEKMRFGDRLDVQIDAAPATGELLVPNMLLQPLLENAVQHGVAPHARPGRVLVHAMRQGDDLRLVVRDSGAGFEDEATPGAGLRITRERLASLYGASQRLDVGFVPGGFEVRVTLPCRSPAPVAAP